MKEFQPSLIQLNINNGWSCYAQTVRKNLFRYVTCVLYPLDDGLVVNRSQLYGEMVGSISGHMLWKWSTFWISWLFVSSGTVMYVILRVRDESIQVLRELLADSMLCHTIRPRWQIPSVTGDSTCSVSSYTATRTS